MDIISQFPDELLIRILSLVPTKHVMATSLLSKRWQFLWSLVSKLEYDDSTHSDGDYKSFTQFVYRSLLLNKAPFLQSLYLTLGSKSQVVDIGLWIDTAVGHRVHELKIDALIPLKRGFVRLPSSLYTCKTLETLILLHCVRLDIPFYVSLPSLKIMHLDDVEYTDKGSLPRLLSGCPKLEQLILEQIQNKLDVTLAVPSLRKLKVINDGRGEKGYGFVIDAPSLVHLHIGDNFLYDFHRIEYMPMLEEAHVDMTHGVNQNFLKALTSVRLLSLRLSLSEVMSPSGMIFHRLVDLELNTCAQGWWDLLTHMLQVSPKLRVLKLTDEHVLGFSSKETPDCWKRPNYVPKCLLYSLEAFEWDGYKGRQGDREMAAYILANAARLAGGAKFFPESDDFETRYMMIKDLESVATPSPWVHRFSFDVFAEPCFPLGKKGKCPKPPKKN